MHRALELPGDIDLSDLSYFLYARGIPHKVTEESGKQVIWTENEEKSRIVTSLYQQWQSGDLQVLAAPPRAGVNAGALLKSIPWQSIPVTLLFMVACMVVALITRAGANWQAIAWFSFIPFEVANGYLYFGSFGMGLEQGEYWRLISPIFLHFGLSHLAFNMLALYIFGSRLETRQGGIHLLAIIVFTAVISNVTQYFWAGDDTIFGGFSGVVYGLMGYCMTREKVDRNWQFGLPPFYYGFMLTWLVVGYTGVLGSIGFGNMANAAHTGGLVAGCLLGAIAGLLFKERRFIEKD
ncbi:rhomboid family intramembrane serine protease [Endozoicomonas acroporae]|uniref:rhomboid family intramembrane serine protease n=1 Tax=Endozoicomonas acroporae TaxID=1701104 RepID=UPI000C78D43C|nr:rhomboid family intramembrane serine protease [Endozoicomonas acroporae]